MERARILLIGLEISVEEKMSSFFNDLGIRGNFLFIDWQSFVDQDLRNEIFDLIIVDLKKFHLVVEEFILKLRKKDEANFLQGIPLIICSDVILKNIELNETWTDVAFINDLFNFKELKILIEKFIPPSIQVSYLSKIAEISKPESDQFIAKLVNNFKESVPKKLHEIEEFLRRHDLDGVSKTAHYLRSTSYNVGANKLANQLKELEEHTRHAELIYNENYWKTRLESEFEKAKASLDDIMSKKSYLKS
jgi:HPt (histidine-containing phosphotransfer) domain-containing protein